MRSFLFIFLLCITGQCVAQDSTHTLYFKIVGWKIGVPENFDFLDSLSNGNLMQRGAKAMEEANELKLDVSGTRTLFTVMNGLNYLSGTITSFDVKKDGSYQKANKQMRDMMFKTFTEKATTATIDSFTTTTVIDGLQFEKMTMKIAIKERTILTMCILYRLYKGYDMGISYLYVSDWAKAAIEAVVYKSKFEK